MTQSLPCSLTQHLEQMVDAGLMNRDWLQQVALSPDYAVAAPAVCLKNMIVDSELVVVQTVASSP